MLVVRLHKTFRERATEWVQSAMVTMWGMILLLSPGTFTHPFYQPLAGMLSEPVWGWLSFIVGVASLVVLFINGAWRRTPAFRMVFSFVRVVIWAGLLMGALTIGWQSPAIATYAGLLGHELICLYFASRDRSLTNSVR